MRDIALENLNYEDFEAMRRDAVREGRYLEYKRDLPGGTDSDKKEFLADASSFANAGGGDVVWGVEEAQTDGKNTGAIGELLGVPAQGLDQAKLRLEQILRNGLDPRIPGARFHEVDGGSQGPMLVLRIPRSWASPHMIKDSGRFFSRNSAGKYPLDVRELRAAFSDSLSGRERARKFRLERLARIVADETPMPTTGCARLCMHIVPVGVAEGERDVLSGAQVNDFEHMEGTEHRAHRHNLDGLVSVSTTEGDTDYAQLFREGAIESITRNLGWPGCR